MLLAPGRNQDARRTSNCVFSHHVRCRRSAAHLRAASVPMRSCFSSCVSANPSEAHNLSLTHKYPNFGEALHRVLTTLPGAYRIRECVQDFQHTMTMSCVRCGRFATVWLTVWWAMFGLRQRCRRHSLCCVPLVWSPVPCLGGGDDEHGHTDDDDDAVIVLRFNCRHLWHLCRHVGPLGAPLPPGCDPLRHKCVGYNDHKAVVKWRGGEVAARVMMTRTMVVMATLCNDKGKGGDHHSFSIRTTTAVVTVVNAVVTHDCAGNGGDDDHGDNKRDPHHVSRNAESLTRDGVLL